MSGQPKIITTDKFQRAADVAVADRKLPDDEQNGRGHITEFREIRYYEVHIQFHRSQEEFENGVSRAQPVPFLFKVLHARKDGTPSEYTVELQLPTMTNGTKEWTPPRQFLKIEGATDLEDAANRLHDEFERHKTAACKVLAQNIARDVVVERISKMSREKQEQLDPLELNKMVQDTIAELPPIVVKGENRPRLITP